MAKRRLRLEGPGARGMVVNAALLRDLLEIIIDGSQKALRIRTQGRSTARGVLPRWIAAATEMDVRILEGSTVLELDAPTLMEADPEEFQQGNLFRDVDPNLTSIDYFSESLEAATGRSDRATLYDKPLLDKLSCLERVFEHGITGLSIEGGTDFKSNIAFVAPKDLGYIADLEASIPPPQAIVVGGRLDAIRHSDRTFELVVPVITERLKGVAEPALSGQLYELYNRDVLVSGVAHFATNGKVLRIEASTMSPASEADLQLWAVTPMPVGVPIISGDLEATQGPRTGLNAILGQWPGDETDEEVNEELEKLS